MDRRHHRRGAVTAALAAALLVGGGATAVATGSTGTSATTASTTSASAVTSARIVRSDAPAVLRIGSPRQTVEVAVQTDQPMDGARVSLVGSGRTAAQGTSQAAVPGKPTTQRARVVVEAASLPSWGRLAWDLSTWRTSDGSCTLTEAVARVDVRAHSKAGLQAVKRSGSTLELRGSLIAYHSTQQRMVPWGGRPVEVQRHNGRSWERLAVATTDRAGGVALRVSAPRGSYLRLVTADTATIWGAQSADVRA